MTDPDARLLANINGCPDCGRVVGEKHIATCPTNLRLEDEARKREGVTDGPPVVLGNRGYETDAEGRSIEAQAIRDDMARLGATPETYAAKKLREFAPKREPMPISLDGISVQAVAEWEWEYDDDGCGGPSVTGNSMTGSRGRYKSVTRLWFDGTAEEALKFLNAALESCIDEAADKIE